MRMFLRILMGILVLGALTLIVILIRDPKQTDRWATLTGVLAVLTAVISAYQSIRILEIQEDAARPYVQVFFDRKSRVGLVLLRVKNLGAGAAYNVHFDWDKHPQDENGEEVTGLDSMDVLLPGDSEKVMVGGTIQFFKKHVDSNYQGVTYQGVAHYKDATGRCLSNRLSCPIHAPKGSILDDDEMDKTVHSLQNIPDKLAEIAEAIKRFEASKKGS